MTSTETRVKPATASPSDRRPLTTAAAVFTVAVLLHNADHLRRGVEHVSAGVFWLGTAALVAEIGVVTVIAARHRLAPLAAALVGAALAVGYLTVHFLPDLGWFSDSFTSAHHVSPMSWAAATMEVLAATVLAATGALRVARTVDDIGPARGLRDTATHPLTLCMGIGNALVLVVSAVQRWGG